MATLVSLDQAKRRLRLGDSLDQDREVLETLDQAQAIILDYLADATDVDWTAEIASWTANPPAGSPGSPSTQVPLVVQAAILYMFAELWRFPGDDPEGVVPKREPGFLTPQIDSVLKRLRRPVVS